MKLLPILLIPALSACSISAFSADLSDAEMKIATESGQFRVTIINDSLNKGGGWSGHGGVDQNDYITGYLPPRGVQHFYMNRNTFVGSFVLDENMNLDTPCPYIVVEKDVNIHVNSESNACWID